jgi:hypothetical protein
MNDAIIPQGGDVWKSAYSSQTVLGTHNNMVWYASDYNDDGTLCKHEVSPISGFCRDRTLIERDGKPYVRVPQGEELIGILCGVSDQYLESAKKNSEHISKVVIISKYNNELKSPYTDITGTSWRYAYPVSKQKLKELMERVK